MERTKTPFNKIGVHYNTENEPIVLSKALIDMLMEQENPSNCIALYVFYYYTAKWQKTNQIRATTYYVAMGLGWTEEKVRTTKKILLSLHLVEDCIQKDKEGKVQGHYIRINFIWKKEGLKENIPIPEKTTLGIRQGVVLLESNALSDNNINALNSGRERECATLEKNTKILPQFFEHFWKIYPRKIGKTDAHKSWNKICKLPIKEIPTWGFMEQSILNYCKTEQWQDEKYIPHPATWLNGKRWLDEVEIKTKPRNGNKTTIGYMEKGVVYKKPIGVL